MSNTEIVVVESGFVFVRRVDGSAAACVRRWGTNKGLGQLAMQGPQAETVLDSCGLLHIATAKVLFRIECADTVWDHVSL